MYYDNILLHIKLHQCLRYIAKIFQLLYILFSSTKNKILYLILHAHLHEHDNILQMHLLIPQTLYVVGYFYENFVTLNGMHYLKNLVLKAEIIVINDVNLYIEYRYTDSESTPRDWFVTAEVYRIQNNKEYFLCNRFPSHFFLNQVWCKYRKSYAN